MATPAEWLSAKYGYRWLIVTFTPPLDGFSLNLRSKWPGAFISIPTGVIVSAECHVLEANHANIPVITYSITADMNHMIVIRMMAPMNLSIKGIVIVLLFYHYIQHLQPWKRVFFVL